MKWANISLETGEVVSVGSGPKGIVVPEQEIGCEIIYDFPDWVQPGEHKLLDGAFVRNTSRAAQLARSDRDALLALHVDPLVTNPLRWAELGEDRKEAIKTYRKELLDVPQQEGFPDNIVWPPTP